MKKLRRWIIVLVIGLAITMPVFLSVTSLNNVAFADEALTSGDVSAIRQNILYKSVYSNLQKCYNNMTGTIDESPDNVWASFDSTTYFKSDALASNFLKFPFDVGKRNESSCPKMITGWKNNWFIDLFKGEGNYSGLLKLNTGAEVPDSTYDRSPTKMGNFLKNIGYTQKKDTTTMGDRKCFYLKFQINDSIYDQYWLPKPSNGSYFETVDFCVKLDGNNNLQQGGDAITTLIGNNEYFTSAYDNGHLTDSSNIVFIYFNTDDGMAPQFRVTDYSGVSWANKNYLQANLSSYIDLRYPFSSETVGNTLEATSISVKNINNTTNAENSSYCSGLGYTWCGWFDKGILYSKTYIGSLTNPGDSINYSTFKSRMKSVIEHMQTDDGYYLFNNVSAVDYTPGATSYTKGATNTKFMKYFLGDTSNFNGGKLSDAEKYVLYYTYLRESYNVATTTTSIDNGVQVSWLNDDGTFSKVYVYDPDENLNDKKYVPQNDQWLNLVELNWKEIAERMSAINVGTAFTDVGVTDPVLDPSVTPTDPDGNTPEGAETPNCFNSAGSLGWILCPVLEGLSSVVSGIYDNVIVPQFLEIDASFMAADSSGSVYKGWTDFRNYANILFAILFIIVIFAQVTGIGISNYNVKKILPRLIMTVVLVNISFILCQLAVDLSNILGFSLKKLFVDMAGETVVTVGGFVGNIGAALVSTTITGGVIVGAVAAAVITWEFWLFPLLLFLLGIIISIFFFAIILGVRKAGILILIVLAPVAIVCYTLPNTKRFFDRWLKMFSSLILVYPICGLLMGGGQYASTILLGAASGDDVGFFMALVAMLIQVVPFFFIPSLVKGSLAAMGNLGMKISNMGSRFSGGIQRGIRGTEGYREAERSLNMRNAQKTFNRLSNKIAKRDAKGRKISNSLQRRRSNAAARYNRMAFEDIRAGGTQELMSPGSAQRTLAEQTARSRQMKEDVSAQESIYKNNPELADDQIMGNVYEDALDELMADPTSREAEVKVQALQNILSETDAGRSQVQNRMMSVLAKNASTMAAGQMNGTETGLSKAAAHLSREHMATYKAKNRGMYSLIGDLSRQQYDMGTQEMHDAHGNVITDPTTGQARRHTLSRIVSGTDSQGKDIFEYRSDHYDKSGLSSYTAETLAGADEGTIDRIMEGIGSGNISDADLQTISTTASEALNSDTVRVQPKIAKKLRQIERAGYAASPSSFARASDASLGDIVGRIQSGEINNANGSTELTRLATSAQSALRDPSALHSPATAERLNQILTAAGAQGAVDAATGSHFKAVDASTIKVRGGRQKVAMPTGWARGADGKWYEGGQIAGRQLNATEVKKAEQIEAHNNQVDIDNGTI